MRLNGALLVWGPFPSRTTVALFGTRQAISRLPGRNPVWSIQEKFTQRRLEISRLDDIIETVDIQPMPDGIENPNWIVPS